MCLEIVFIAFLGKLFKEDIYSAHLVAFIWFYTIINATGKFNLLGIINYMMHVIIYTWMVMINKCNQSLAK